MLVVDARQGPTELDRAMRDWLVGERIAFLAAATKADKLSGNGRARALPGVQAAGLLLVWVMVQPSWKAPAFGVRA